MRPLVHVSFCSCDTSLKYLSDSAAITDAQVCKEFAEDKEHCLEGGEVPMHETTSSAFVYLGLELEDMQ